MTSPNDYIVKKVDFTDLSDKAKAKYFKALYALHAKDSNDVGNNKAQEAQEPQSGRFLCTDRSLGTNTISGLVGSDGSGLVPLSERRP